MTTERHSPEWLIENADHGIAFEVACASALTRLLAANAELQQQLEAIGAGGVGPLIPATVQHRHNTSNDNDLQRENGQLSTSSSTAPAGWKLVPVEPTIGMCMAGDEARVTVDDATRTPAIYRLMLAAAPQPPTTKQSLTVQPQGEQEPVAWIENLGGGISYNPYHDAARKLPDGVRFDLYVHQQNLRCKSNQARLAALWGYVKVDQQPQGEQKPMAWMVETDGGRHFIFRMQKPLLQKGDSLTPLYTRPKPRKPLTVEQIDTLEWSVPQPGEDGAYLAQRRNVRAIERAHGIGGES